MGVAECAHVDDIFCLLNLRSTHMLQHSGCYLATAASLCSVGNLISGRVVLIMLVDKSIWPAFMLPSMCDKANL